MQGSGVNAISTENTQTGMAALAVIEYRIATHMQGAYENIIEVGRCLCEAKDAGLVPHGQWEEWVSRNTGMSVRSAQKLMQTARSVSDGSSLARLPISKITTILSLPEPEREPMAERAVAEDMSLRELQEAVKREKKRADQLAVKQAEAERQVQALERKLTQDAEAMAKRLEEARTSAATPPVGISPEAQAEIDRLTRELAEAESYAEQQAELRQKAQRDLLNRQAQAARGETAGSMGLSAGELASAVRTFIGAVGILPHLGSSIAQIAETERAQMRQQVDMVAAWVDGARRALSTVIIHDAEREVS